MKKNWWLFAFCIIAAFAHAHFSKEKKLTLHDLQVRLKEMEGEKLEALRVKEDLELKIASQNDPAWIEIVLIRELGVVPEGFLKVHFKK